MLEKLRHSCFADLESVMAGQVEEVFLGSIIKLVLSIGQLELDLLIKLILGYYLLMGLRYLNSMQATG